MVHSLSLVVALWFVAGIGGTVNLVASAAYVQTCPREFRSRAYGVAITSLNAMQGLVLLLGGALASRMTPQGSVAVVAALTLTALGFFTLRSQPAIAAQENRDLAEVGKDD